MTGSQEINITPNIGSQDTELSANMGSENIELKSNTGSQDLISQFLIPVVVSGGFDYGLDFGFE